MNIQVRTSSLRGYEALMRQLGGNPTAMLKRHRISATALHDEDAMLSLRSVARLLEESAEATSCSDFGLRLAMGQDISVLGPLAIAMQNAATVGDALVYAARYLSIQSAGLTLSINRASKAERRQIEIRLAVQVPRQAATRQINDLSLADLHLMVKLLAGRHYVLHEIGLPHSPLAPRQTYRRFFSALVLTDQAHAFLRIADDTLHAKVAGVNESVRKLAVDYLSTHASAPDRSYSSLVRKMLGNTMGSGTEKRPEIARMLGMRPRTLQRRLEEEGTRFDALRDEVRMQTALRYLSETRIPVAQIASLVGLSEQSALTRACRRWYNMSPLELRHRSRSGKVALS